MHWQCSVPEEFKKKNLPTKSRKNYPQKLLRKTQIHFFSLLPWAAQTKEFMFQIVADRPNIYRTGARTTDAQRGNRLHCMAVVRELGYVLCTKLTCIKYDNFMGSSTLRSWFTELSCVQVLWWKRTDPSCHFLDASPANNKKQGRRNLG